MAYIRTLILLIFLGMDWISMAQINSSVSVSSNTLITTSDQLPFWLWANQQGKYDRNSNSIQNLQLSAFHRQQIKKSDFRYGVGTDLDLIIANENSIRFTQFFGAMDWKFLSLQLGAFADKEVYGGLSTTNGNLAASRNARPHPRIRIGFNQYAPFLAEWFSVYGFYEEGLLDDNRYVKDARLHNKVLYLRFGKPSAIQITAGLEHKVMWAGTHPVFGELQGWEVYCGYVLGKSGNEDALETDQANALGNSYGTYQFQAHKALDKLEAYLYISHPYEDTSGREWENWHDNLYGLFLFFNKEYPFIKDLLVEYYYTEYQSGSYHLKEFPDGSLHGTGRDNYFNHGIYRSGATYQQMAMVSPLFAPVVIMDGISVGFESTRFSGIHIAASGFLIPCLHWKTMVTYSNNLGQYRTEEQNTYDPTRQQLSTLVQIGWKLKNMPVTLNASLAGDHGSLYDAGHSTTRVGSMFSILWNIR